MTQLIYSKMPKIPTAGMTWTVSREKRKTSWFSTQDKMTNRLLFRISTSHWYEQYSHYEQYPQITISTVPQKSKGTSYCRSNSYYSQQSWQITVAVGGKSISPKWKQDSSGISAASDAPFSLYKGAHSSVFRRLKTSTTATEVSHSSAKVFTAEIP